MPKYSIYVNKEQDEILKEYGKLLVKEGLINEPITPYKIAKFIFNKLTNSLKEKNVLNAPSTIIDENTPIEKEQKLNQMQIDEEKIKGTATYDLYKKIR